MRSMRSIGLVAALTVAAALLTGCVPEPVLPSPTPTVAAPAPRATPTPPAIAPFPTGPSTSTTPLPTDCEGLLPARTLAELDGIALNAPGMGGGIRADSTRVCIWADPAATLTRLVVIVGYAPEREAADALYLLGRDEGYTCYQPDDGVRCEKTWRDPDVPVAQGRTLFYRDGVIIDTQYAGLAPEGFTSSIIATVWP